MVGMKAQKLLPAGNITIFVDVRETKSNVVRHLRRQDISIREIQLKTGDYILSDRVAVERKTIKDFLQSITDQRIFRQLEDMSGSYEKPVLMLEGNPEFLFLERDMHPNVIRGALSAIAIDYSVPVIWTYNSKETAAQIYWMARREQAKENRELQLRCNKKAATLARQQEYLLAGLPFVSNVLSRRLLKRFKTPKRVFSAKIDALMKIDGLGEKKAKRIWEVINRDYEDS